MFLARSKWNRVLTAAEDKLIPRRDYPHDIRDAWRFLLRRNITHDLQAEMMFAILWRLFFMSLLFNLFSQVLKVFVFAVNLFWICYCLLSESIELKLIINSIVNISKEKNKWHKQGLKNTMSILIADQEFVFYCRNYKNISSE